jgi:hypothetical protein
MMGHFIDMIVTMHYNLSSYKYERTNTDIVYASCRR